MINNTQQILPGFTLNVDASFSNFYTSESMALVKNSLLDYLDRPASSFVFLCGAEGTGKSHLLQALCNMAVDKGMVAIYLPLRELKQFSSQDILDNSNVIDVFCIDDVDAVAGDPAWELELFHLYNRCMMAGKHVLFSASTTANELSMELDDLKTRLTASLGFQLPVLSDNEKAGLIQYRAALSGIEINDACVQYIVQRSGRNLAELLSVLERLDKESLVAGRKITVPFIKSIFHW